jgi:hypothetical protein
MESFIDFKNLFSKLNIGFFDNKYDNIFLHLKPTIKEFFLKAINDNKKKSGRPIKTNIDHFLDALYRMSDEGIKMKSIEKEYKIPKSTFCRYFKIFKEFKIVENIYNNLLIQYPLSKEDILITDTFTVKSMDGNEGLGKNPCDRGRKGLKVSLISDTNYIARIIHIDKANNYDAKVLRETIKKIDPFPNKMICLADSGYVGKDLSNECLKKNINLVSKPRRTRNPSKMTHILNRNEKILLSKYRNRIELLNGNIRRFRGLMIKYVKKIDSYQCLLYISLLCITFYNFFNIL